MVIRLTGSTTSIALIRLRESDEKLLGMWKLPSIRVFSRCTNEVPGTYE